jgi:metallophosphoesterase superfamily enzyme
MITKKRIFLLCLLLLPTLSSAEIYNDAYYANNTVKHLQQLDDATSILIVGDWGRNGHFAQKDVARWMDIAAYQLDAEMIISTGDNFYDNGIASVQDPYWQTSYESIYNGPHLFVNWYAVLGNHDYRGNWQAQIDYSRVSRRWQMPAQYYDRTLTLNNNASVHLVFIDTSPLNPDYADEEKYQETQKQAPKAQLKWLRKTLNQPATWTLVIGHHPLYSSGKRYGKNTAIRDVLEPILEQYKVDAYIAGHEHDLQHNQPANTNVEHFVSGGGSEVRPVAQREFTTFAQSSAGFASLSMSEQSLLLQFINDKGEQIYHYSITKKDRP